jgi:hypothetical protein
MRTALISATLGGLVLLLAAHPAQADAIDGAWCLDTGMRMMISGPSIVTPAGTKTQGNYSRHAFSYVVPATDPGAGTTVSMLLVNEETVRVRNGTAAEETWHRCGPSVSAVPLRRRPV